jgi:hypothetical protein
MKMVSKLGIGDHACSPSYLGGWGKIAWVQKFEVNLGIIVRRCLKKRIPLFQFAFLFFYECEDFSSHSISNWNSISCLSFLGESPSSSLSMFYLLVWPFFFFWKHGDIRAVKTGSLGFLPFMLTKSFSICSCPLSRRLWLGKAVWQALGMTASSDCTSGPGLWLLMLSVQSCSH